MVDSLSAAQLQLLFAVCFSVHERASMLVDKLIDESLSSSEVNELCELISNEFMMSGIREDFEPNSYGIELEILLDAVNRYRNRGR